MQTLLNQTRKAMKLKLYYIALLTALSIPDIAGTLSTSDGRATKENYVNW
jgi:hypothetical protein